ncbi:hypothetical protein [Ramlibacter humi]|uniref:Uncharacterized protein n=1 Tax=Ramlibacter humi TaxID=2530451 RepID=A0A4Z0BL42_9BURK|nr:hypothetical protein [Ramlibacter humi]TFZ00047.1 hypothetical protein EZ216_13120 [Ramlibacter humi]
MTDTVPHGGRQALSLAASTLLLATLAFAAWMALDFGSDARDVVLLAGIALVVLAAVPLLAAVRGSLRWAAGAYALGTLAALACFAVGMARELDLDDGPDEPGSGEAVQRVASAGRESADLLHAADRHAPGAHRQRHSKD